ncbi:hypothetical protein BASA61_005391 [Batrachochytrium salamandrivorans]|nr:hypothetical protein BASA61_005391 [Batrachochytrium salamandrivorans]
MPPVYHKELLLQLCQWPYRKVTYRIKTTHLHLRILNQKRCAKVDTGYGKLSSPCPQQKSPPEPQPSTSYDPPQSDEMPLPIRVGKSEAESYRQGQNADQYNAFTKEETEYFELEYSRKKKLGQGSFGVVFLATKESNGMEVAYKSISKKT